MIATLTRSGFSFKAQSPYRVLWKTLGETSEVKKQGSLYGLKELTDPPSNIPIGIISRDEVAATEGEGNWNDNGERQE